MRNDEGVVRAARQTDLDRLIAADHLATAGDRARREALAAAVAEGSCLVAEADTVLGYVVTKPAHFFGRDFIELLMVHPDHRRAGIGRRLLRAAVEASTTASVFTSTNRSNAPMRALLASEAWTFRGEVTGLDEGDPELFFSVTPR